MNARERVFISEYPKDLNATQAAIRAGYSPNTAAAAASRLLRNVNIFNEVEKAIRARLENNEVTADRVIREVALIAFSDIKHFIETNEDTGAIRVKGLDSLPQGMSACIKKTKEHRTIKEDSSGDQTVIHDNFEFELHDKMRALELLADYLKIIGNSKVEHSGNLVVRDATGIITGNINGIRIAGEQAKQ